MQPVAANAPRAIQIEQAQTPARSSPPRSETLMAVSAGSLSLAILDDLALTAD
jgi:hypothetical protein